MNALAYPVHCHPSLGLGQTLAANRSKIGTEGKEFKRGVSSKTASGLRGGRGDQEIRATKLRGWSGALQSSDG